MPALISYAQNFEDVMLWRALEGIDHGSYIDVGAQHPSVDSVSQLFYEHGWRGISVEPTPHYADLLRKARPDEIIVAAAVGTKGGMLSFYEFPETGLSTVDREIAEKHISVGYRAKEIVVPCVTLDEIFHKRPRKETHWLKIDVEGGEKNVLESWVRSRARPWIVVVESTYPMTQVETHHEWEPLILRKGYKFAYFDGLSRFYIANGHDELLQAFSSGPNVFDVMFRGFSLGATTPFCGSLHTQILSLKDQGAQKQQEAAKYLAMREAELSTQLSAIEHQSAQQLATHEHKYREQCDALQHKHLEREQVLNEQLWTGQQELHRLGQELAHRENVHRDLTSQNRTEVANLLQVSVRREQEFGAQLLGIQQQAAQQLAATEESHREHHQALQRRYSEREKALSEQLQLGQSELHRLGQVLAQRERLHGDLTAQIRNELANRLQVSVQREQEVVAQLLGIRQQATQQLAATEDSHREQHEALERKHLEREQTLSEQLLAGQQELHRLGQELAQREKAHGDLAAQIHNELADLLQSSLRREQEFAVQLRYVEQQAAQQLAANDQNHRECETSLRQQLLDVQKRATTQIAEQADGHREREDAYRQQWRSREREIAQRFEESQVQLQRLVDLHNAGIDAAQQTNQQLSSSLAEVQARVSRMQDSLIWRLTAPLRAMASFVARLANHFSLNPSIGDGMKLDLTITSAQKSNQPMLGGANDSRARANANEDALSRNNAAPTMETTMPSSPQEMSEPTSPINGLQELADAAFIQDAEKRLLGRTPDPDGMRNDMESSRLGNNDKLISAQIVESSEGKAYKTNVAGLRELGDAKRTPEMAPAIGLTDKPVTTIEELMGFHDAAFVDQAYRLLLGREVDPEGRRHYLGRLREGDKRESIVAQIATSAEAKMRRIDLPGLQKLVTEHTASTHWFWGMFRRSGRNDRQVQRLENQLGRLLQDTTTFSALAIARNSNTELTIYQSHNALESELQRTAQELSQTRELLEAALARTAQSVANFAHETNARITSIELPMQQAHRTLETELGKIEQEVKKLTTPDLPPPCVNAKEYEDAIKPISVPLQRTAPPKFSIIILQYHKSDLTINCVRSVLRYTDLNAVEIIVVDNGSPREHITNVQDEFGDLVSLIEIGTNRYFGEGNNIGVDHALGEFVVFMNNDVVVTRGWLDTLAVHLKGDVQVVGPAFLFPTGRVQECGAYIKEDGDSIQQFRGGDIKSLPLAAFECDYISAATVLLRKETFLKVGGFDLCYEPAYYEDVDLCLKIASYGGRIVCDPKVRIFHNENATSSDVSLGLRLTNDIVATNKTKFLDRWRAFLSNRISNPIENQKVIGTAKTPVQTSKSRNDHVKTKRAILFSPYPLTPGGGEKYLLTIAQALSKQYQTTLTFEHSYSISRLRQLESYLNLDLSDIGLMDFSVARDQQWDVAFVLGNSIAPPFQKLSPVSFYICQFPFDRESFFGKAIPFVEDYQYVCYSDFVKTHILRGAAIESSRVAVLAPVIQSYERSVVKEKIIVSVGRFFAGGHCKNQQLLIEAFKRLVTSGQFGDWKLILVGSTRPEHEHRMYYRQCRDAAVGLNVEIIPDASFDVLGDIYARAAVYWHGSGLGVDPLVHPERLEHFGITPLEAASAGCQVFVPDAGGPSEIAKRAPANFHVYKSVDDLVGATAKVCSTIALKSDPEANNMAQFIASFSLGTFSESLSKLVARVSQANMCGIATVFRPNDHRARWTGWSDDENGLKWSKAHESRIEFLWGETTDLNPWITIRFHTLGSQRIRVQLNGAMLVDARAAGEKQVISFEAKTLSSGFNSLVFSFPDAHQPGNGDGRLLALRLRSLSFSKSPESADISSISTCVSEPIEAASSQNQQSQKHANRNNNRVKR